MEIEKAINEYKGTIEKLAKKNNVDYEIMLENWRTKYSEFDKITDKYGFNDVTSDYLTGDKEPFIALTVNGSILIVSEPDSECIRRVRYQSIKIRTDESANVPEIFNGVLSNDVSLKKTVNFENVMETSPIIMIKKSDTFNWDEFEDVADELTLVFTKRFEKIDNDTIIKNLE